MSPVPLVLSFLISNMLALVSSMISTSWLTAACSTLRSIQSSANAIMARLVETLHFAHELHTERLMVHTARQSTDNLARGRAFFWTI